MMEPRIVVVLTKSMEEVRWTFDGQYNLHMFHHST